MPGPAAIRLLAQPRRMPPHYAECGAEPWWDLSPRDACTAAWRGHRMPLGNAGWTGHGRKASPGKGEAPFRQTRYDAIPV
jgi:hypothetical protein